MEDEGRGKFRQDKQMEFLTGTRSLPAFRRSPVLRLAAVSPIRRPQRAGERSALHRSWAGEALHQEWVAFHRSLLRDLRAREIAPLMAGQTAPRLSPGCSEKRAWR